MAHSAQDHSLEEIDTIDESGDVVLAFQSETERLHQNFKCSRSALAAHSHYFRALLDPQKFSEGVRTEQKLKELRQQNGTRKTTHDSQLPVVTVSTLPVLFVKQSDLKTLLRLTLLLLSDRPCSWPFAKKDCLERKAQMALLSECFGTIALLKRFNARNASNTTPTPSLKFDMPEISIRQWFLVGLLLNHATEVKICSAALIVRGSRLWLDRGAGAAISADDQPAWNNLPFGAEEELQIRRQRVIDTLTSIQSHFVTIYSRQRQCKKGYSNSLECDSFHLGEAVKFFMQKGTLALQGAFTEHEPDNYEGSLVGLEKSLRQCPPYQLDPHHAHCGVRQRLMPILDRIQPTEQVGICLKCWQANRLGESWAEEPSNEAWSLPAKSVVAWRTCEDHKALKAMYTAYIRDWTPSEVWIG